MTTTIGVQRAVPAYGDFTAAVTGRPRGEGELFALLAASGAGPRRTQWSLVEGLGRRGGTVGSSAGIL